MKPILRDALVLLLSAVALSGQTIGIIFPFPPQLKQYLDLSDDQIKTIAQQNSELQNYKAEKFRRVAQVQFELAQETAKPVIDPMALGLRHLELESIQRDLRAEQEKTDTRNQSVLTPAQKTKLQALRQAAQLMPVVCEAQTVNVLGPVPGNIQPVGGITDLPLSSWFDIPAFLPINACATGRTGSFVF